MTTDRLAPTWISVAEAAIVAHSSVATVYRWVKDGRIQTRTIAGKLFVDGVNVRAARSEAAASRFNRKPPSEPGHEPYAPMRLPLTDSDEFVLESGYCTVALAAEAADCSRSAIYRWIRAGQVRSWELGTETALLADGSTVIEGMKVVLLSEVLEQAARTRLAHVVKP